MSTKEQVRTGGKKSPRRRPASGGKKPRTGPEVVYTQPGPFNRNRFILHLLTIVAVVLALVFGMSLFFTVKNVEVSGMEKYTAWQIREASGIKEGENLLGVSEARLGSQIEANLPYISKVRVKIKLPDTVHIMVEELDVVYSIASDDGQWWLMRADGRVVDKTNAAEADGYTKISGLRLAQPQIGEQAVAEELQPEAGDTEDETMPITVKGSERLETVISILEFLESNGIIGSVASLDVSNMNDLQLWYGERFQVLLGDTTDLAFKVSSMKSAINQMGPYQTGVLDISFTIDTGNGENEIIYTPFE